LLYHPKIEYFENQWVKHAAEVVLAEIRRTIERKGNCSLMLTGGNTVQGLYAAWRESVDFPYGRISFFFGDERCVPCDHPESNYAMVMRCLFPAGSAGACGPIWRLEGDADCAETAALNYERLLPEEIDVLLLSVGEDGHIASLFADSPALQESKRRVLPVTGLKAPYRRLTITPPVLLQARSIFVLAAGAAKAAVLREALRAPSEVAALPARLVLGATWLLDCPLPEASRC